MSCVNPDIRIVKCGEQNGGAGSVSTPFGQIGAAFGVVGTIIGVATTIVTVSEKLLSVVATLGGAAASGVLAAVTAAILVIIVIGLFALDRCIEGDGIRECVAGAINGIITDFSSALDELFPFTAMHTRVDLVVKSRFWNKVEQNNAYVHCTNDEGEHRSELIRCFYFTPRVCNAATGSQIGAIPGAVAGIIAAAIIAAAIGCATVILCLFALLLAIIVAVVATLVGALIGGQIAKNTTANTSPTSDSGSVLSIGDLVTVHGNMKRRDEDQGANLFWFAHETGLLGHIPAGMRQPLSYCEINDLVPNDMDGCFFVEP